LHDRKKREKEKGDKVTTKVRKQVDSVSFLVQVSFMVLFVPPTIEFNAFKHHLLLVN